MRWLAPPSVRSADFGYGERVDPGGVQERFDSDFFAFGVAGTAGGAVVERFDAETRHDRRIGIPQYGGVFRRFAEYALVAGFDGLHERMIFGNLRARYGDENLVFNGRVSMFLSQIEDQLLDGYADLFQRHRGRNADIEKNVSPAG